ncbi:hypothetical protein PIIN_10050 [Serendipita indica DSM 11827]|uniref:Uncharacterized protein n=1 Tax=Serendipita indica (strain DSM 11827) TaxID=1109443 RepID=G4TXK7_SERID|nr:hypothetical protein PIIN_10050 [Serendipita indica DSM 11827]
MDRNDTEKGEDWRRRPSLKTATNSARMKESSLTPGSASPRMRNYDHHPLRVLSSAFPALQLSNPPRCSDFFCSSITTYIQTQPRGPDANPARTSRQLRNILEGKACPRLPQLHLGDYNRHLFQFPL